METKPITSTEVWMDLALDRRANGLTVWVRTAPQVEAFIKALTNGNAPVPISKLTHDWRSTDPNVDLMVYSVQDIQNPNYVLNCVGGTLGKGKEGFNLSFLQFVGISLPDGIRFLIADYPFSKQYLTKIYEDLTAASCKFFKDYVVPAHFELQICSKGT